MTDFNLLRVEPVNVLRYLPKFLATDFAFKRIQDTLSWEHEQQRLKLIDVVKQFYVSTATWGLSDWEAFLGIEKKTDNIELRRQAILIRLNNEDVVNAVFLNRLINQYVADESGYVIEHPNDDALDIMLPDGKITDWDSLVSDLNTYIPAHIGWIYKAYLQAENEIIAGGVISTCEVITIEADKGYREPVLEETSIYASGVISDCTTINIVSD